MSIRRPRSVARGTRAGAKQCVRIIGGEWRSRLIRFVPHADLRPTGDRVRETLFNWLQPLIQGSRCLDLFAGSGALGFEAASRGAASVTMVEGDARVAENLTAVKHELGAMQVHIIHGDARRFLSAPSGPYDIVFLDPPFTSNLLGETIAQLAHGHFLAPDAWVYVEHAAKGACPALPPLWRVLRQKQVGEVGLILAQAARQ